MIVVEALGELVEAFGGSRIGHESPMSTKCCSCQRFGGSQEALCSPGGLQISSESASGDALEALGEFVDVFGGSRIGQQGPMSANAVPVSIFEAPRSRSVPQRCLQVSSGSAASRF